MEKRVFLAIFLSFAILALYQAYFAPAPPPPTQQKAAKSTLPSSPAAGPTSSTPEQPPSNLPAPNTSRVVVGDASARDVVVDSDTVSAVFTTRGGVLKSWRLKKYSDAGGQPLELVPQDIPEPLPRPF